MALLAIILLLIHAMSFGDASDGCPDDIGTNLMYYNTGNTSLGSPFQQNWLDVYQVLLDHAPQAVSSEFSHGQSPNTVSGFALCIKGSNCKGCLQTIKANLDRAAPLSKGARLCMKTSTDVCYMRYEAYSFNFNCLQGLSSSSSS
ncbi:hypothetical protein SELMODRAFT_425136 [Selaginella moellendorffii]|uniref:Gnk2-homologous domain-containing protein n=1 Tax=Selaginella moellendorffii TaxID=88036 RepID=D8SS47_SELML|nr:hypothetical protein SELMODRAFT_425136 [Selaginella moellendorffii]